MAAGKELQDSCFQGQVAEFLVNALFLINAAFLIDPGLVNAMIHGQGQSVRKVSVLDTFLLTQPLCQNLMANYLLCENL